MSRSLVVRIFVRLLLVPVVIGATLFLGGRDSQVLAISFNGSATIELTNAAPNAVSDITWGLAVPAGDLQLETYIPIATPAEIMAQGPGHPLFGAGDPNLGDIMGVLTMDAKLGLNNNTCSDTLNGITFKLINATVDHTPAANIDPLPWASSGLDGVFANLDDDDDGDGSPGELLDANGLPNHVDHFPFEPKPNYTLIQEVARYSASTMIAGTVSLLNILVYDPIDIYNVAPPSHYSDLKYRSSGYIMLILLAWGSPSNITDMCSPLTMNLSLYGESKVNPCNGNIVAPCNTSMGINNPVPGAGTGLQRYRNPLDPGTYLYFTYLQSGRDLDYFDDMENGIDTCPYVSTPDYDPRAMPPGDPGDDPDLDRIPGKDDPNLLGEQLLAGTGCDPTPLTNSNSGNHDLDIAPNGINWLNAEDNCPLVANSTQDENEYYIPYNISTPRGGPEFDQIGDACDLSEAACAGVGDDDADLLVNDGCLTVGGAIAETPAQCGNLPVPLDEDGDGLFNDGCATAGLFAESGADCLDAANDDPGDDGLVNDGCPAGGGPELGCLNNVDDEDNTSTAAIDGDGAVNDGCPGSADVANGHYHTTFSVGARCVGAAADDDDKDGYCDADENEFGSLASNAGNPGNQAGVEARAIVGGSNCGDGQDNDGDGATDLADAGCRTPEHYVAFVPLPMTSSGSGNNPPASREPVQICNDGIDNDNDGAMDLVEADGADAGTIRDCSPAIPLLTPIDTDGDGFTDEAEIHIGTDALGRCERGSTVPPSGDWPADLAASGAFTADRINVVDLAIYIAPVRRFGTAPGDADFDRRWDVVPGTTFGVPWINVVDLAYIAFFIPPMFEVRAFNGPVCSAHRVYGD